MKYLDTNVIIAYMNENDVNHSRALRALEGSSEMITSPIAELELKSVLSRTTDLTENDVEAYVDYTREINVSIPEIDMNSVFRNAEEISYKIKMKTLDLLHLSACLALNATVFVTFDKEFAEKKKRIREIGIEVQFS